MKAPEAGAAALLSDDPGPLAGVENHPDLLPDLPTSAIVRRRDQASLRGEVDMRFARHACMLK